jgi:hypothetical protein
LEKKHQETLILKTDCVNEGGMGITVCVDDLPWLMASINSLSPE